MATSERLDFSQPKNELGLIAEQQRAKLFPKNDYKESNKYSATNPDASFSAQLIGVLAVNIFIFIVAYIVWSIMKATVGLRLSKEAEVKGTDVSETGVIAYAIRD